MPAHIGQYEKHPQRCGLPLSHGLERSDRPPCAGCGVGVGHWQQGQNRPPLCTPKATIGCGCGPGFEVRQDTRCPLPRILGKIQPDGICGRGPAVGQPNPGTHSAAREEEGEDEEAMKSEAAARWWAEDFLRSPGGGGPASQLGDSAGWTPRVGGRVQPAASWGVRSSAGSCWQGEKMCWLAGPCGPT